MDMTRMDRMRVTLIIQDVDLFEEETSHQRMRINIRWRQARHEIGLVSRAEDADEANPETGGLPTIHIVGSCLPGDV